MSDRTAKNMLPENVEPTAGSNGMRGALIVAFALAVYVGYRETGGLDNNFSALVYAPYTDEAEAEAMQVRSPVEKQFDRGAVTYRRICSGCHLSNGQGQQNLHYPPLDGSDWVIQKGPSVLVRIVNNGLSGDITVKNEQYGKGVMEPVGASLTDDEVADLLTYIRDAWSNSATPVKPEKVNEVRKKIGDREAKWTVKDLKAEELID